MIGHGTQSQQHEGRGAGQDGGQRGVSVMGLLTGVAVGLLVAFIAVPGLGWVLGIGVAFLAGTFVLAMQGGAMCGPGHGGSHGGSSHRGC